MVRSILKRRSSDSVACSSSVSVAACDGVVVVADGSPKQKRVSFDGAEPRQVFQADEWDRSPAKVTPWLTYTDVIELRELDVYIFRTGPLRMERTQSRRPSRQRTSPPNDISPKRRSPPPSDGATNHESPISASATQGSPTYQCQTLSSKSSPPLLEDSSKPSDVVESSNGALSTLSEPFTYSPPGLSVPVPRLNGLPSTAALDPPSSSLVSPSAPPHSLTPKLLSRPAVRPAFSQHFLAPAAHMPTTLISVPENLAQDDDNKGMLVPDECPVFLSKPASASANPGSQALGVEIGRPRRAGISLMGWEMRRSFSNKCGFELVRKSSTSA